MFNITELFMASCALWFLTQETIWLFSIWNQSIASFQGEKPQRLTWCWAKATRKAGVKYMHVIVYVKVIALWWFSTKISMWNCFYGNNSERLVFQLAFRKGRNQWIASRVGERKALSMPAGITMITAAWGALRPVSGEIRFLGGHHTSVPPLTAAS